jgi:hypothetical protein
MPSLRAQVRHEARPGDVGFEIPDGWKQRELGCMEHRPPFGFARVIREEAQSLVPSP